MVRSGGIRGFEALVTSLGGNAAVLLRRHRIPVKALRNEDALIPFRSAAEMLEEAASVLECPDFGLRLGGSYDPTVLGPLAVAVQHSGTVVEALQWASRYLFVQTPAMTIKVVSHSSMQPELAELRVDFLTRNWTVRPQTIDLCLAGWHALARSLAGRNYQLEVVCLPHEPTAPLRAYRRAFGAQVRVAQPYAALLLSPDTLSAPLHEGSKVLQQLAADYLRNNFSSPHQSVTVRVREAIRRTLGSMAIDKVKIAAMLSMHPRTLQRHLAAEGTHYEGILDEVRQQNAQRYLQSTHLPMKQITALIGLSHQSSLARYCNRWFGVSPSQVRTRNGKTRPNAM